MSDRTKAAHDAAEALAGVLWPAVEEYTSEKGVGALPALMALARPYLRSALARVEGVELPRDHRTVPYHISAMFWELNEDDATDAELVCSTEDEGESVTCHGLQACLEQLALWLAELHDGEEVSEPASMEAIVKRVPSLRVSIGRGAGSGEFRVNYTADGVPCLAHATVSRVEEEGDQDDDD